MAEPPLGHLCYPVLVSDLVVSPAPHVASVGIQTTDLAVRDFDGALLDRVQELSPQRISGTVRPLALKIVCDAGDVYNFDFVLP